jgi:hypothetical protein
MNKTGTSSVGYRKDHQAQALAIPEAPDDATCESTPPPAHAIVDDTKTPSSKGKEVPSGVHEEHGYVPLWTK